MENREWKIEGRGATRRRGMKNLTITLAAKCSEKAIF